ncbi:MAG: hypothetical protein ACFE95_09875 [Candidatus Hodarchaeota archaeon]
MKVKSIILILLILFIGCSRGNFVKDIVKKRTTCQMEVVASTRQKAIEKADKILWEYQQLMWSEGQKVIIRMKSCEKVSGEGSKYLVIYTEEIY